LGRRDGVEVLKSLPRPYAARFTQEAAFYYFLAVNPIIEIAGVNKYYGDLHVVKDLSFVAGKGTCVGLLGPNGAGKTTLVRMLTAQYPYASGSIKVFEKEVASHPREVKALMGIVPQTANLDPDFSVEVNLRVYSMYYGVPKAVCAPRIAEQLAFWGLLEKRKAKIDALSGGMVRRLLVARAMINNPGLLVMDEPTTGLDPQSRRMVWDKITGLKQKGITILLTTHYMEEAQKLCDRVVVMNLGEKVADDVPEALIRNTMGEEILETENQDVEWISWKNRLEPDLDYFDYGTKAYLFCKTCGGDGLGERAVAKGLKRFSVRAPNLEDVYLKITGKELS
jgi:lipooligosaccharide transport system ATP-binding protein